MLNKLNFAPDAREGAWRGSVSVIEKDVESAKIIQLRAFMKEFVCNVVDFWFSRKYIVV